MNKAILIKLYNEAANDSNDLMDKGRAELALELIIENAEFVREYYPNYDASDHHSWISDLSKIVFKITEEGDSANQLLKDIGYSRAFTLLVDYEFSAYQIAIENKRLQLKLEEPVGATQIWGSGI